MDDTQLLFLSLKPKYAAAILSGDKTIELRRSRPLLNSPTSALLYASSPQMALVGSCVVERVISLPVGDLWGDYGAKTGVSYDEYSDYFEGKSTANGLVLSEVTPLSEPVGLEQIRKLWAGFQPPQSFLYVPFEMGMRFVAPSHIELWNRRSR